MNQSYIWCFVHKFQVETLNESEKANLARYAGGEAIDRNILSLIGVTYIHKPEFDDRRPSFYPAGQWYLFYIYFRSA